MDKKLLKLLTMKAVFDAEGGESSEGNEPSGEPKGGATPSVPDALKEKGVNADENGNITISVKDLNEYQKGITEKLNTQHEQTLTKVEELVKSLNTTQDEKDRVENAMSTFRSDMKSKLNEKDSELENLRGEFNSFKDKATEETTFWKQQFQQTKIQNDTQAACTEAGVLYPQQVMDMLATKLELQEVMDEEGKKTGSFRTVVKTKDEEGKDFFQPVSEHIKFMDEKGTHPNLFAHNLKEGLGMSGGKGGAGIPDLKTPEEIAAYMRKNPDKVRSIKAG